MTEQPNNLSRWKPIPRSRRLIMDVLYWHRQVPTTAHDRICDLSGIAAAREQSPERIAWSVLFLKAYAIVAQKFEPLRQAFVRWPWPHLVESPHSVGMLVTHRDVDDEPWLFWSRFDRPETKALTSLQKQLNQFQTAPVETIFKRQWLLSALPTPLRRALQWWTLRVGGSKRAKRAGTFTLTTIGSQGAEIQHPPAFLTGNLTFGPLDSQNRCRVTLAYDHRLLDGRMVAHILAEMEQTLNDIVAKELSSSQRLSEPAGVSPQTDAIVRELTPADSPRLFSRATGSFSGKNAIVTGASSGIGLAIAKTLAAEGMNIVLAARSREPLEQAAAELRMLGVKAIVVPTDVTDTAQLERLVATARTELGSIDVLVNNAGIENYRHFHLTDLDSLEAAINLNLTAAIKLTRLVVPHMLEQRRGQVINMSSLAGKYGPPFGAAYGASKAGLVSLTQSLRAEYRGTGVTASVICPGFAHDSGMFEKMKVETGASTPWQLGSTTTDAICRAVVKALRHQKREVLVNFPPAGWVFATAHVWPWLGEQLLRLSAFRFLRRLAQTRATADAANSRRAA